MDPMSAIGLVGAIIGVFDAISRNVSTLMDLQSGNKIDDLKVSLLPNTEKVGLTGGHQDLQLESPSYSKSPKRFFISVGNEIRMLFPAVARKPSYRKLLQIPGLFKPQLQSHLIAEHRKNKEIERWLESNQPVEVLILGLSGSGKSTLMKSIDDSQGYWTDDERRRYKSTIFKSILDSTINVLNEMEAFQSDNESADFVAREVKDHILETSSWFDDNVFPPEFASAVKALWTHPSFNGFLERCGEFAQMDCAEYFFKSIDRIANSNFLPSIEDVMWTCTRTRELQMTNHTINNIQYNLFDCGRLQGSRKKWIHFFESAHKIIFVVDIAAYDEILSDDLSNWMAESLHAFESICTSSLFPNTQIIVFLHKVDKLERKLAQSPLKNYFPDYDGDPADDVEQVKIYFRDMFLRRCSRQRKAAATVHFTSISDLKTLEALTIASITGDAPPPTE